MWDYKNIYGKERSIRFKITSTWVTYKYQRLPSHAAMLLCQVLTMSKLINLLLNMVVTNVPVGFASSSSLVLL